MAAFPVAPNNRAPITDAGEGAKHQIVRPPASVTAVASNPVPVAAELKGGTVGVAYSETISAQGGTGPYTFAVTSGAVPAGTAMSSAGVISGTPTTVGTYSFTATVTDTAAATGAQAFVIEIADPATGGGNYGFVN